MRKSRKGLCPTRLQPPAVEGEVGSGFVETTPGKLGRGGPALSR